MEPSVRQQLVIAAAVTAATLAAGVGLALLALKDPLLARMRGEVDLLGNPIYAPPFAVDGAVIDGIDFARVHGELLPDWMIAQSNGRTAAASEAMSALRAEAGRDENLDLLLVELDRLVQQDAWGNAEAIERQIFSWNTYMDTIGAPFWVDGTVMSRAGVGSFYTKSYAVRADLRVGVGEGRYRERVLQRIDRTNVVEMYHGKATTLTEGGFVLVDRLAEFATEDVWPALDPKADGPFDQSVRAEVMAGLPPDQAAVLVQTAPDRRRLVAAVRAIQDRRSCGSRFRIYALPWWGLDPAEHTDMREYAESGRGERCPEVTDSEATAIIEASEALAADRRLQQALESLVAWLARGTAVHEARHVADLEVAALGEPLPCEPCGELLPYPDARAELSAYLASFANAGTGASSLFKACAARDNGGPHGAAMDFVLPQLAPQGCEKPPPADLYARAAQLELDLFGRSEPVDLTADFPLRLGLGQLGE